MGIDLIRGGRIPNRGRRDTKSSNTYLKTLIKVHLIKCSFIHSYREELILNLTQQSTKDSINQGLIVILFLCQESTEFYQKIVYYLLKRSLHQEL